MLSVLDSTITPAKADRTDLLRAHYEFQRDVFFTSWKESDDGVYAASADVTAPMWNHVSWFGGGAAEFRAFVTTGIEWQTRQNRRPVVYVDREQQDEQGHLREIGFEKFDEEAWMELPAEGWSAGACDPEIATVGLGGEFAEFVSAFTAAFQARSANYGEILRRSNNAQIEHFALRINGQTRCIGTLVLRGGVGCIYNVGTPPAYRKQGGGARMMRHIIARAAALGCATLFLQVENQSNAMRLYQRLGFRTAFVRTGYRLGRWAAREDARPLLSQVLGSPKAAGQGTTLRDQRPLSGALSARLAASAKAHGATLETIFAAAWGYLVHRYSGETTVAIAMARDGQGETTCRVVIDDSDRVSDMLARVEFDSTASPAGSETILRFGATAPSHLGETAYPLDITLIGTEAMEVRFQADAFTKDSVRRMLSHLETILTALSDARNVRVADLEILPAREKHQLLVEWNEHEFVPVEASISSLFEAQVERSPDSTALMVVGAVEAAPLAQLSYRQLNRAANRLAHRLRKHGVRREVFVGVCLERTADLIISLLAVFKAGGVCVPLDPAYPVERIAFMVQDTGAPVIITTGKLAASLAGQVQHRLLCLDREAASLGTESDKNMHAETKGADSAYVIYTSGSTGQPKGVVISQHAIANHSLDCKKVYGLNRNDRILQFSSFNFDASFEQILPALLAGSTLIMRDNEIWNTAQFTRKLEELQLTVADIPTAYWHELTDAWSENPESVPPNNLRLAIVGGEALSPEKAVRWLTGPMRQVRLINAYGPTETTITATSHELNESSVTDGELTVLPIGRPRGDRTVYVLDRRGQPTPTGVPGELHIGGSMLARGYHNRPELTAAKFIPNPFSDDPEARLYKTGDLVRYLEDGNLEFLGRIDDQVKIRGFRIELGEVEAALRKHDLIRDALAMARADEGGEKRLVAYVTSEGATVTARELREHLKASLPEYMIPQCIVVLEKWPLMPNGKVDRRALPEPVEATPAAELNGPREPLELQLQLIFERVLKRAPIGVDASFFEMGGDSLQALELLVEIEKATGKQLPLGTLYQSSTVEALAQEVNRRASSEWSSLVPLQKGGSRPPLYLMHTTPGDILGYGNLVYRLGPEQPCYGFQSLGLKDPELGHGSIEQMAAYYVDLLQKFQPRGPYYLGGWCYGGIVAVEMARLLVERGEKVGLLALLETVAMPPALSNFRYYLHRIRCSLQMGPRRWREYVREKARYARDSRMANRMRFRQAVSEEVEDLSTVDPRLAVLERVYNANLAALKEYKTHYYAGEVTLFNAAEKDPALIPDAYYGWVGLADSIRVCEVPGNHDTMLTEPNVSVLARELSGALEKAFLITEPSKA